MSPMLFLAPLYWPNKVVLKSLHELFELFTGVNEDKYGSEIQIEGEIKKITLLRLSSINEKENNTIKSKNELEELERDLREMRNKKKGNEYFENIVYGDYKNIHHKMYKDLNTVCYGFSTQIINKLIELSKNRN